MPPHGSPKAGQSQLSPTKPGGKSPEKGHRRPPLKYPKLVADKGPDTTKLPPSEMLFPSEEAGSATVAAPRIIEFLNIADYTHNVSTIVPVEEPLFQPSPMHILFKSFEPQQVYSAKLCFRNNDYVGRRMKIQEIRWEGSLSNCTCFCSLNNVQERLLPREARPRRRQRP